MNLIHYNIQSWIYYVSLYSKFNIVSSTALIINVAPVRIPIELNNLARSEALAAAA